MYLHNGCNVTDVTGMTKGSTKYLSHTEGNRGKSEGALTIMDGTFELRCGKL